MKIAIFTSSALRHQAFAKIAYNSNGINVVAIFHEEGNVLKSIVENRADADIELQHLKARDQTEKDYFELYLNDYKILKAARTLTAVMPGNSPSSMRKATGRALPSSRTSMPPHSLGGQSYAQQRQWRASSRSRTSSAPSAKHLRPRNETTPPVPSLSLPSRHGSAQVRHPVA